jgi:hypothetical protein
MTDGNPKQAHRAEHWLPEHGRRTKARRQRPAARVCIEVNLGAQPAAGAARCLAFREFCPASRLLPFDTAPCEAVETGQFAPSPCGVVVRANHRGVHAHHPLALTGIAVRNLPPRGQHPLPRAVGRPPAVPVVGRLPWPMDRRQVLARTARPGPPPHHVDHPAVITPPTAATRPVARQPRVQPGPLRIRS